MLRKFRKNLKAVDRRPQRRDDGRKTTDNRRKTTADYILNILFAIKNLLTKQQVFELFTSPVVCCPSSFFLTSTCCWPQ